SRERAPVGTPPSVGGAPSPELVASPALAPGREPEPVVSLPRITATSPVPGGALGSAPEPAGAAADGAPPSTSELAPTTGGADEDGSVTEAWLDARGTSASGPRDPPRRREPVATPAPKSAIAIAAFSVRFPSMLNAPLASRPNLRGRARGAADIAEAHG